MGTRPAEPKKGSPIVDEALLRIAALYKIEDSIRGCDPGHRQSVRQNLSRPLVDEFFTWLAAHDLPLNFHPAAIRAPAVFDTPFGAVGATGGNA